MSGLAYVGPHASDSTDLVNRHDLNDALSTAVPNRTSVISNAIDAAALRGSKTYIDNHDASYVLPVYYTDQDALNIPTTARGAANGVASLDANVKIPLAQIPPSGEAYLLGPFGPHHTNNSTAVYSAETGTTPAKIADWEIGATPVAVFRPLVFMSVWALATDEALPVIEVRISDGPAAYASQASVALGYGRTSFNAHQAVVVWPAPDTTGQSGLTIPPTYDNPYLTAWVYDPNGHGVSVGEGDISSAVVYLLRTDE